MITAVTKDIMCTYICNSSLAPSFKSLKCCFLGPFTYTAMFSHTAILQIRYRTVCKIKTHDSESRGQEEAGRTRRTSELFTRSTALKFCKRSK